MVKPYIQIRNKGATKNKQVKMDARDYKFGNKNVYLNGKKPITT